MGQFWVVLQWTIIAAIILAILLNAGGAAQIVGEFGKFWVTETQSLSGTAGSTANYIRSAA